jgi:hypothetical protein
MSDRKEEAADRESRGKVAAVASARAPMATTSTSTLPRVDDDEQALLASSSLSSRG